MVPASTRVRQPGSQRLAPPMHTAPHLLIDDETFDRPWVGGPVIAQRRGGQRFTSDALLLARAVADTEPASLVDLGAGTGVVVLCVASLLRARRGHLDGWHGLAVEVQPELAARCAGNVERNELSDRIEVVCADTRSLWRSAGDQRFDAVAMNPPYYVPGHGRLSPNAERAASRHALHGALDELVAAAARALVPGGTASVVYPVAGMADLERALADAGFVDASYDIVSARPDATARRVIAVARTPQPNGGMP